MILTRLLPIVVTLGRAVFAQLAARAACKVDCAVIGELNSARWTSRTYGIRDDKGKTRSFDKSRTGTVKIITVINTVEDTTSVITSLVDVYEAYTPPLTNSVGTALGVYTHTFRGETKTITLAYPTPFFIWPEKYGVDRFSNVSGDCIGKNSTVEITSEPQPTGPFEIDPQDPLGWGYDFDPIQGGGRALRSNIGMLPENTAVPHSAVETCSAGDLAFEFVARFVGPWKVVAQVSTVTQGDGPVVITPAPTGGLTPGKTIGETAETGTVSAMTKSLATTSRGLNFMTEVLGLALTLLIFSLS